MRRRARATSSSEPGLFGETGDFEVGAMHAKQKASVVIDSVFVVGDAGAVGGANFAEGCIGLRHDVGNAERAADFD